MAKIHTVEWTPGILANPVLERAMNANWYGVLPRWVRQKFGHVGTEMIGGIVGSDQDHHTAPYAITEEFVAVYRLHPLLPDDYAIRDHETGALVEETGFDPIQGHGTRPTIEQLRLVEPALHVRHRQPGRDHAQEPPERAQRPRAADRGPGRPRDARHPARSRARRAPLQRLPRAAAQAADRAASRTSPTIPPLAEEIRDVYDGDIDRVDLQVGLLAEPLPPGFGFSDTAFRIFILMASRRLKSDRFFTNDYSPDVYTPEGINWVEGNTMVDVLLRHHPELGPALDGVENAFAPWNAVGVG